MGPLSRAMDMLEDLPDPLIYSIVAVFTSGAIYSTANEMVQWYDNLFAGNIINQASLQELTYFDKTTFYALGVGYHAYPTLPDDEVDGDGLTCYLTHTPRTPCESCEWSAFDPHTVRNRRHPCPSQSVSLHGPIDG